jgi:hypothetical protein
MAYTISPRREDKFVFLFVGEHPTSIDCRKDVQNLYETLTTWYNYLPGNISVVYGGTAPSIPATHVSSLASLQTQFTNFATMAKGAIGGAPTKKGIIHLYFTGAGAFESLTIEGSAVLSKSDLQTMMITEYPDTDPYYLHLFMQQDQGRSFSDMLVIPEGAGIFPCTGPNAGTASGSNFTLDFVNALKFYLNASSLFADQVPGTGETDMEDYHISLAQAVLHAGGTMGSEYIARPATMNAHYLGIPQFLVRDGSPYWESPDIKLTHAPGDEAQIVAAGFNPDDYYIHYAADPNGKYNFVNVTTRNYGTHPVRIFQTGVKIFESGPSGSEPNEIKTNNLQVTSVQKILIPIPDPNAGAFPAAPAGDLLNVVTTTWSSGDNLIFPLTTHRCIRAKVGLLVTSAQLDDWANLLSTDQLNEAQRNLDCFSKSTRQGEYQVYNPFRQPVEIYMPIPGILEKVKDLISCSVKERKGKEWIVSEPKILKKTEFIRFKLKAGEIRRLRIRIESVKEQEGMKEIRVPFEFLIATPIKGSRFHDHAFKEFREMKSFGGLTLVISSNHAQVNGLVTDAKGKGVPGAEVLLASADGMREWKTTTEENGAFILKAVSNGLYGLTASKGKKQSFPVDVFVSKKNEKNKVKIVLV